MADDRERNQGMKQGTGEGGGQHAPGRNPQDDRSAGGQQGGRYSMGGELMVRRAESVGISGLQSGRRANQHRDVDHVC